MSLLNQVNITCDELEATAADLRDLETVVGAPVSDGSADYFAGVLPEVREHVAAELAKVRRRLELLTRALHEERGMTCRR